jgi:hypothetical protein
MDRELNSIAELAMRLRKATGKTPLQCEEFIRCMNPRLRLTYVEAFEKSPSSLLRDPLEFDPEYSSIIEAVKSEARVKLDSGEFGVSVRGRSIRMWGWVKEQLKDRFGIVWLAPYEINPDVVID